MIKSKCVRSAKIKQKKQNNKKNRERKPPVASVFMPDCLEAMGLSPGAVKLLIAIRGYDNQEFSFKAD
jgi:hypothetical protein